MALGKKGLGKGLGALISAEEKIAEIENIDRSNVIEMDINKLEPNPDQPRKKFNQETLEELAESIKEFGLIQPIVVNKEKDFYRIIAGERRYRASRLAKLTKVPVIIKTYDELQALQVALIENIQREDLNPIEEALCYQKLEEYFFFKKEDIAKKIGKSRNTVSSVMGLLALPDDVQNLIVEGKLTAGAARALLSVEDSDEQFAIAQKVIEEGLSVKLTEKLVEAINNSSEIGTETVATTRERVDYRNIESSLNTILGTKVNIRDGKNKGKIEIEYYSVDELDRLVLALQNLK